jgi:hypothetical protein
MSLRRLGQPFARHAGPIDRAAAIVRRPLDHAVMRRLGRMHEVAALGRACSALAAPGGGPRVLFLSLRGWPNHVAIEGVLAHALRLRGAEVALLTCGGGLPACEMGWARNVFPRPCDRCAWYTDAARGALSLPSFRLVDGFDWGRDGRRAPMQPPPADIDLDWAASTSVPWFLKTTHPEQAREGAAAERDHRVAASVVHASARRVLAEFRPDLLFMVNGEFTAERVIREMALERGMRVITYEMAPRADTLFLSHDRPACEYNTDDAWAASADRPLTAEQRQTVAEMLELRSSGKGAHESYFDAAEDDETAVRGQLGIPAGARVASLFTNLSWDSAALGRDVAFPTMVDWIARAAAEAGSLEDFFLVIRIHPGEARWGTNEDIGEALLERLGSLPSNVRVVSSDQAISSYAVLDISSVVLVYTSTVGLEAAYRGLPVIVAGATHYRGRGFTCDVAEADELGAMMAKADLAMDQEQRELAERYAFTFFYRALMPFPLVPQGGGGILSVPTDPAALQPGADPYLDLVCDGVLEGHPFVVPDELVMT